MYETTSTSEVSHLYKIAHGYNDSQYLTVGECRKVTSRPQIELCASFYNTRSYTTTAGTVTLYGFYYIPVFIPSYSTTSYSDCVDGGYKYYFFNSSSQTTLSGWYQDDWITTTALLDSDYDDYILGIYVYLKWKSSNKNDRIMLLHPSKIGSAII